MINQLRDSGFLKNRTEFGKNCSTIATTANIYTHLDYSSKVNSANAIMDVFENEESTISDKKIGLEV